MYIVMLFVRRQIHSTLHVLVRGPVAVDIRTSPLIVIGFDLPAMTVDDFYGKNMASSAVLYSCVIELWASVYLVPLYGVRNTYQLGWMYEYHVTLNAASQPLPLHSPMISTYFKTKAIT